MRHGSAAWLAPLLLTTACGPTNTGIRERHREIDQLRAEIRRLEALADNQQQTIESLQRGMSSFTRLGEKRLSTLFKVDHIEIGRLSGGRDFDGQQGDDGVTVYVRLFDQDGHAFKAAGDIDVYLYDLENPTQPLLLRHLRYDVDATKPLWYGRGLTYHYKVDCMWADSPPRGRDVTLRVHFLDYLTGETFQATRAVTITPRLEMPR
jgi:hypothetical protein